MADLLPEGFEDLERFVSLWDLETETDRIRQRLAGPFEELQALYDGLLPRIEQVLTYLNGFPLDEMPPDAKRLMNLTLSLAEVAPAVEFYQQTDVVDGFDPSRFEAVRNC